MNPFCDNPKCELHKLADTDASGNVARVIDHSARCYRIGTYATKTIGRKRLVTTSKKAPKKEYHFCDTCAGAAEVILTQFIDWSAK